MFNVWTRIGSKGRQNGAPMRRQWSITGHQVSIGLVLVGMGMVVVKARHVVKGLLIGVEHVMGRGVRHMTNASVPNRAPKSWGRIWNIAGFRWDVVEFRDGWDLRWTACGWTWSCSPIILYFITY